MIDDLYNYKGFVIDVYDGDTCRIDIDLGFNLGMNNEKIRLARINAPEIRGASRLEGIKSRDYLRKLILNKEVLVKTYKDRKGKFGRYLADIWIKIGSQYVNVNDDLVEKNYAKKY